MNEPNADDVDQQHSDSASAIQRLTPCPEDGPDDSDDVQDVDTVNDVSSTAECHHIHRRIRQDSMLSSRVLVRAGVCFGVLSIVAASLLATVVGVAQIHYSDVDFEKERWPAVDDDGFYLSYKDSSSSWVNWWLRNRPSFLSICVSFIMAKDESAVPDCGYLDESQSGGDCELDKNLPVRRPYWLSSGANQTVGARGLRATWLGHSTVLAEVDGALILCDPQFSHRASPVQWSGPKRYRPPACKVNELPDILHAVVISHTHYDHLDRISVKQLNIRYGSTLRWFVPSGVKRWFESEGVSSDLVTEMTWWQEEPLLLQTAPNASSATTRIVFTPSNHWSKRTPTDTNAALWGSWTVLGRDGSRFWFGGDTAYADVFKQIGDRFGPLHLAAIPIGAYSPRKTLKFFHVNPEEALLIHRDIRSLKSFGIHWGTFQLSNEYYMEPKLRIQSLAGRHNFSVLDIGHTVYSDTV